MTDPSLLVALATELEKEGQYNAAKLLRAAATATVTRESTRLEVPTAPAGQADLLEEWADRLDDHASSLATPMRSAAAAIRSGTVPVYGETPDPQVCRICGLVRTEPFTGPCQDCGRWPTTAERVRAIYWLRASAPPEAIRLLSQTPETIESILRAGDPSTPGPDGGWSAHQTLEHLHNAQGVFRGRIDQLVAGGEPELASVMVWTMDGESTSTTDLFAAYRALRTEITELLSSVTPEAWWNVGSHEEFGRVTLAEQASYFANHEPTHLTQLAQAARAT